MRLNREQWVFVATVALVGLCVWPVVSSYRNAPLAVPKSQPVDPVVIAAREGRPLKPDEPVWDLDGRNIFAEPREEEDLRPLELPLPPLPERPWIQPPIPPDTRYGDVPMPSVIASLRVPQSAAAPASASEEPKESSGGGAPAVGANGDDEKKDTEAGDKDEKKPANAASDDKKGGAPVPRPGPERTNEEIYDRIHNGTDVVWGKVVLAAGEDPLANATEDEREPGRFVVGASGGPIKFRVVDLKTGKFSGQRPFTTGGSGPSAVTFELAATPENQYRIRLKRVKSDIEKQRLGLARWCEEQKLYAHAFEQYRLVQSTDPAIVREAALGAARSAEALWRFDDAQAALDAAIAKIPEDAPLYAASGRIQDRLGLTDVAEASLRHALKIDPGQWAAALRLASLESTSGDREDARELFQKVASGSSVPDEKSEAQGGLARLQLQAGKFDEALAAASRADELRPTAETLVLRAAILDAKGDRAGADKAVDEALSRDADCASALTAKAIAQARSATPDAALATAEKAWAADPAHPFWALVAKGCALLKLGKQEEALVAFRDANLAAPRQSFGHYELGRFSLLRGNVDAAQESLSKALALAPDFVECAFDLADSSLREDDRESAQRYLRYAAAFGPETPESLGLLGYSYLEQKKPADAEVAFEKVREKIPGDPLATTALAYIQYRKGGDGVFRAVETFKELADQFAKKPGDPFCAYARAWREAIRDNISKVEWHDSFARDQIKGGWVETQKNGLTVALDKQRVRIGGTQRKEGDIASLDKPFEGARILRYEVSIEVPANTKVYCGASLTKESANQTDGIYFGKDETGRIVWRSVRQGKPGDWIVVEGASWPGDGKAVIGIERVLADSGGWRLTLNGKPVVPLLPGDALAPRLAGPWRLGVFGQANLGVDWQVFADDVRVLMTR